MYDILLNKNDINPIIKSYENINNSFRIKSLTEDENKKRCKFFVNNKECEIICYLKKNGIRVMPIGKNIEECNLLIKYIESKGFSTSVEVKQIVFPCKKELIEKLVENIINNFNDTISINVRENIYRFTGYNGDVITFTFYPQTNKAMLQGRPFYTFSIIITYLSELSEFSLDQIVIINNTFSELNLTTNEIRDEMHEKLGNAYNYLDEALLKSISGSISLIRLKVKIEDYTGCIAGEFKALEGYLKKILSQKYKYKIEKHNTFSMFHRNNNSLSLIDSDETISKSSKTELYKLYGIYCNKRNVFLHSTVDPSQTRIIETLIEAKELSDEILCAINNSYSVIFN